jgi:protein phosphatase 1G
LSKVAEEVVDACLADDPRKTTGIGGDNMTCLIVQLKERAGGKRGGGGGGGGGGQGGATGKGAVKEPRG